MIKDVKKLSQTLIHLTPTQINEILLDLADRIPKSSQEILAANQRDLDRMSREDPKYDRLLLTQQRLLDISHDIRSVAALDSPLGKVLEKKTLENGLEVSRISVPLGVIGIIYEARPNVTFDVFSLCFKSGNALVLKGGADADASNQAIVGLIHSVLKDHGVDPRIVTLLPASRDSVKELLESVGYVDIIIPRGGRSLIDFVRNHSKVPVIETGAGIVHTYVDEEVDLEQASSIITNAKTRRVSVCNALDTLIIHEANLPHLPRLVEGLAGSQVEIVADTRAFATLEGDYPKDLLNKADSDSFGTEFLSLKMAIKTVDSLQEAMHHIAIYSSQHSEAILSTNTDNIEIFLKTVDAASVYANTSTAFTDGAQFGLGAEIGISTQKLHARGPMGLRELTSYKWIVRGKGQVRN